MATKAQKIKSEKKPKYKSRIVHRCWRCGRQHGYMGEFGICRICFRELACKGSITGIRKSSW